MSFKTQSSIFYHFSNSYSIAIVDVLLLIHYPLEKYFKEVYISSVFYSGSGFSDNLVSFGVKNFYGLFWTTMEEVWVSLIKIISTYKTQSSRQKIAVNMSLERSLYSAFSVVVLVECFVHFMLCKCYWILINYYTFRRQVWFCITLCLVSATK